MKLFYMPGASSLAAHIVLEWTGAAYEALRLDRRTVKSAEYLSLNPAGTVPFFVHGDLALTESVAILGYLADLHPQLALLGDGSPRSRAEVMRWLAFLNSDLDGAFRPIFFPKSFVQGEVLAIPVAEAARHHVRDFLRRLDSQLQDREWLTGSRTVADAYLFVMLGWAFRTKVDLQTFDNLLAFARRLREDDGVYAALAHEEDLAVCEASTYSASDALRQLTERLGGGHSVALSAEVVGPVEYREGEGMAVKLRTGIVQVEVTYIDTVFSWVDGSYRGEAAMPYAIFSSYVADGAIRLFL